MIDLENLAPDELAKWHRMEARRAEHDAAVIANARQTAESIRDRITEASNERDIYKASRILDSIILEAEPRMTIHVLLDEIERLKAQIRSMKSDHPGDKP